MEKQSIFFDIDGTLMGASRRLKLSTLLAVQLAKMKGHHVYLCTGRSTKSIDKSILGIGFDGVIASAGGHIEVNHHLIFENAIDKLIVSYVILLFTNHHILFSLEAKEGIFQVPGVKKFFDDRHRQLEKKNVELMRFKEERRTNIMRRPISEFDIDQHHVFKITFISPNKEDFEKCRSFLEPYFNIVIFSKEKENYQKVMPFVVLSSIPMNP